MILVNVVQTYSALFGELCALRETCRRKGSNPHSEGNTILSPLIYRRFDILGHL